MVHLGSHHAITANFSTPSRARLRRSSQNHRGFRSALSLAQIRRSGPFRFGFGGERLLCKKSNSEQQPARTLWPPTQLFPSNKARFKTNSPFQNRPARQSRCYAKAFYAVYWQNALFCFLLPKGVETPEQNGRCTTEEMLLVTFNSLIVRSLREQMRLFVGQFTVQTRKTTSYREPALCVSSWYAGVHAAAARLVHGLFLPLGRLSARACGRVSLLPFSSGSIPTTHAQRLTFRLEPDAKPVA